MCHCQGGETRRGRNKSWMQTKGTMVLIREAWVRPIAITMVSGRGDMPAFGRMYMYNAEQVQDIASWIVQELVPAAGTE